MLLESGHRALDCRTEVHDAYNARIDEGNRCMAWGVSGVNSWYKSESGRVRMALTPDARSRSGNFDGFCTATVQKPSQNGAQPAKVGLTGIGRSPAFRGGCRGRCPTPGKKGLP